MYPSYLKTAAQMLSYGDTTADPGLLNADLAYCLRNIALLTGFAGGELRSRQAIATAIVFWEKLNPNSKAYGE